MRWAVPGSFVSGDRWRLNADGGAVGELSYFIRSHLGRQHCALCAITHGTVREKDEWKTCRDELPVPFEAIHLNERDPVLRRLTDGQTPCIVADTDSGPILLLGPDELARCDRSPRHLIDATNAAIDDRHLST